jgi:hypothetical protein
MKHYMSLVALGAGMVGGYVIGMYHYKPKKD